MGARWYVPALGVFSQFDTLAGSALDPLSLNRYLYARADPTTLIDPTGRNYYDPTCDCVVAGPTPPGATPPPSRPANTPRAGSTASAADIAARLRRAQHIVGSEPARTPAASTVIRQVIDGVPLGANGLPTNDAGYTRLSGICSAGPDAGVSGWSAACDVVDRTAAQTRKPAANVPLAARNLLVTTSAVSGALATGAAVAAAADIWIPGVGEVTLSAALTLDVVSAAAGYGAATIDLVTGHPQEAVLDASGATLSITGPVGAGLKVVGRLGQDTFEALHLTTSWMANGFSDSSFLVSIFGGR